MWSGTFGLSVSKSGFLTTRPRRLPQWYHFVIDFPVHVKLLCDYSSAEVLDHTKTPCANLRDFVPDTVGKLYVFYIRMDGAQDYTTWNNVARCFRMWDLDVRGFHNSMWRFWIKKNHILVVGCPASVYCALKPDNVSPIYLPNKETRPRDDVK